LVIWEPSRSTAALPLDFSSLLISMYTISFAGSNKLNFAERANTCPQNLPVSADVAVPAVSAVKYKVPPVQTPETKLAACQQTQARCMWQQTAPRLHQQGTCTPTDQEATKRKEKKRKDYAFRRQFIEKPSIIPGCPVLRHANHTYHDVAWMHSAVYALCNIPG